MSDPVQTWLPLSAYGHAAVRRAVARAVDAWSQDWLSRRSLAILGWTPLAHDRRDDTDGEGWRRHGDAVAFSVSRRAADRLVGWALDDRVEPAALNEADRRLLEEFGGRLLGDLAARLDTAFGGSGANPPMPVDEPLGGSGVVLSLAEGAGSPVMSVALPGRLLLPFVKTAPPPPKAAAERPIARAMALAATQVRLSATLGRADLSLTDLQSLAPGDVLVLDRRIAEGAALAAADGGALLGRAAVTEANGQILLTLTSPS